MTEEQKRCDGMKKMYSVNQKTLKIESIIVDSYDKDYCYINSDKLRISNMTYDWKEDLNKVKEKQVIMILTKIELFKFKIKELESLLVETEK